MMHTSAAEPATITVVTGEAAACDQALDRLREMQTSYSAYRVVCLDSSKPELLDVAVQAHDMAHTEIVVIDPDLETRLDGEVIDSLTSVVEPAAARFVVLTSNRHAHPGLGSRIHRVPATHVSEIIEDIDIRGGFPALFDSLEWAGTVPELLAEYMRLEYAMGNTHRDHPALIGAGARNLARLVGLPHHVLFGLWFHAASDDPMHPTTSWSIDTNPHGYAAPEQIDVVLRNTLPYIDPSHQVVLGTSGVTGHDYDIRRADTQLGGYLDSCFVVESSGTTYRVFALGYNDDDGPGRRGPLIGEGLAALRLLNGRES